jgi:hypothetical protein
MADEDERWPDFTALFPVCRCGDEDSCERCAGFQLTPRTAATMWTTAEMLGDSARQDVEQFGDAPVTDAGEWDVFGRFPKVTWRQDAAWRLRCAQAFDDMAGDGRAGRWPKPRCPAEEMALHLVLREAPEMGAFGFIAEELARLPAHRDDDDWGMAEQCLLQDLDILTLFGPSLDGIEDPGADINREFGIGDYRSAAWFNTFRNMQPRHGS